MEFRPLKMVFKVRTQSDNPVSKSKERLACTKAAVVFVVFVKFHCECPVKPFVADSTCEPFVRQEHFFISRMFIHIEDIGFHPFHRNLCSSRARNVAPIPAFHLETASE